jgi:hypothetical protein
MIESGSVKITELNAVGRENIGLPITNADRIRAMSDEELATKLYLFACVHALDSEVKCKDNGCKNCWLDWLKSPAETEGE